MKKKLLLILFTLFTISCISQVKTNNKSLSLDSVQSRYNNLIAQDSINGKYIPIDIYDCLMQLDTLVEFPIELIKLEKLELINLRADKISNFHSDIAKFGKLTNLNLKQSNLTKEQKKELLIELPYIELVF